VAIVVKSKDLISQFADYVEGQAPVSAPQAASSSAPQSSPQTQQT